MMFRKLWMVCTVVSAMGIAGAAEMPPVPPQGRGIPAGKFAGEKARPDRPEMRCTGKNGCFEMSRHKGCPMMPAVPMNEDEMAKFTDLKMKIRFALEDFREQRSEINRKTLKKAIDSMVEFRLKFEVERCEKALARAKAKCDEKEEISGRLLKKLIRPEFPRRAPAPMPPRPQK